LGQAPAHPIEAMISIKVAAADGGRDIGFSGFTILWGRRC
jgi:hypothetical protein